jgi:SPP1 gp7 family putative phage head morphogenesis protein
MTIESLEKAYAKRDFTILGLEAGLQRKALTRLQLLRNEIIDEHISRLHSSFRSTKDDPEVRLNAFGRIVQTDTQKEKLRNLFQSVNRAIFEASQEIGVEQIEDLGGLAVKESAWTVRTVEANFADGMFATTVSPSVLETMAKSALVDRGRGAINQPDFYFKDYPDLLKSRFKQIIESNILKGKPITTAVREIKEAFPGEGAKGASNEIKTFVRSATQTISNQARLTTYERSEFINKIEWVTTFDTRTSTVCMGLDGQRWKIVDGAYIPVTGKEWPGPIAHPNCRSTQIPIVEPTNEFLADLPKGQRANFKGRNLPAGTSFDQFFLTLSKDEQIELLGPGRFEAFEKGFLNDSKGNLDLGKLTNRDSQPLTLDQID